MVTAFPAASFTAYLIPSEPSVSALPFLNIVLVFAAIISIQAISPDQFRVFVPSTSPFRAMVRVVDPATPATG